MDRNKQSADQRKQLLNDKKRTGEEWEELALKVLLLYPELGKEIRDTDWSQWRLHKTLMHLLVTEHDADQKIMLLGCKYEPYPLNRIAKALRKFQREARQALSPEARQREYQRYIKSRPK